MTMLLPDAYDLFLDLSEETLKPDALEAHLDLLRDRAGLLRPGTRLFLVPPRGVPVASRPELQSVPGSAGAALGITLAAVSAAGRALVLLQGVWLPGNEVVAELLPLADTDPLVGSLQPRFVTPQDDRVLGLPTPDGLGPLLPRAALTLLPATLLTPELPAPLLVLPRAAVQAAAAPPDTMLLPALLALLAGLRRKGFRNLVCNRVTVACPLPIATIYPAVDVSLPGSAAKWQEDIRRARTWLAEQPERRLEQLISGAFSPTGQARILLDARGLAPIHNGTAQALLGILDGFARLPRAGFELHVVAGSEAAAFHGLTKRLGGMQVHYDRPSGTYAAVLLLNQPWDLRQLRELHQSAFLLGFNILDTIAWDVVYAAGDGLDQVWRWTAALSDMLFFISAFSRDRFRFRFRVAADMPLVVSYLSLAATDLNLAPPGPRPFEEPYLLVIGNDYDHKDTAATVARLADAFPYTRIVTIGPSATRNPRVTAMPSGYLDAAEIVALEAHAAAVVFPSFYEGFGLPVVQGLARGRTVIARRSPLWEEIAGLADLPGHLVCFEDETSLTEAVGRALYGEPPRALPGRTTDALPPPDWAECADRMLRQIEESLQPGARQAWYQRDLVLASTVA